MVLVFILIFILISIMTFVYSKVFVSCIPTKLTLGAYDCILLVPTEI